MNRRGFSLIELVVVIALIAIILTIVALEFSTMQRKARVERYVKEIYSDLQDARSKAAFTKVRQGVDFASDHVTFLRFASETDTVGTVVSTKMLPITLTTSIWTQPSNIRILFDTRGNMVDPLIKVVCVQTTDDVGYDSLIITPALTSMGKRTDRGVACGQNNVTQK